MERDQNQIIKDNFRLARLLVSQRFDARFFAKRVPSGGNCIAHSGYGMGSTLKDNSPWTISAIQFKYLITKAFN